MALNNNSPPEQLRLLQEYCGQVQDESRKLIQQASQQLEKQGSWMKDQSLKSLQDTRERLEQRREWLQDQVPKQLNVARTKIQDHGSTCLQTLRLWWDNFRAWCSFQWRKSIRPMLEPFVRWCTLQWLVVLEFVRLIQLRDYRFRMDNFIINWKDELFRLAIFFNIFLLLTQVTNWQMSYMKYYAGIVSSQTHMETRDLPFHVRSRSAALSRVSPLVVDDDKMQCLNWKGPPPPVIVNAAPPPTGLVVTMLLGESSLDFVCSFFPGQLENFLLPQALDVLFLVPPDNTPSHQDGGGKTMMEQVLECLQLSDKPVKATKKWKNLDGSTLTTSEYVLGVVDPNDSRSSRSISVFLGETVIELPRYVREDPSILQKPMTNRCDAPVNYISATRWYTDEMLHLSILKDYEYFVKLDTDVAFVKQLPFNILHDMKLRGALFGHTANFARMAPLPCGDEITTAIKAFQLRWLHYEEGDRLAAEELFPFKPKSKVTWGGAICSSNNARMHMDTDYYYSNLIIGRTDYFQREEVRALGRFMTEYPHGFFKYRWTDQSFWHFALGLFVNDFEGGNVVADYTDFRCAPLQNCWWSYFNRDQFPNEMEKCRNGGAFVHSKSTQSWVKEWSQLNVTSCLAIAERPTIPYESQYRHECPQGII